MPLPPCAECGFDGAGLSPRDAAVALRTFPRRFAALLDPGSDDDDSPAPSPEVAAATRMAVAREASGAAREVIAAGEALRRVLIEDTPLLGPSGDPPVSDALADAGSPPGAAIATLAAAVGPLAELVETTKGAAWERTGTRAGQPVRALDLLAEAVHAGAHHLRAAGAERLST